MSRTELLPWLADEFHQLISLAARGKLAHAYLFGGQEGLGKLELARHFAGFLLCSDAQGNQPCGACRDCQLLAVGTHPDLKLIQPEDSSEIRIEQVREIIDFIVQTSTRGGHKVVIFRPAEAMNVNSANALLKVLEEPGPGTLIILVSHQPALLLPTIRSRCHFVKFNRPSPEKVIPWLEAKNIHASPAELLRMANNVPLRALHYADDDALHERTVLHSVLEKLLTGSMDIADATAHCEQFSLEDNIEGMILCVADILAYNQSQSTSGSASLHDHDLQVLVEFFRDRTKLRALHDFYRELLAARRAVSSTSNPNPVLVLESLFYNWAATGRKRAG